MTKKRFDEPVQEDADVFSVPIQGGDSVMRTFDTGATRDTDSGKYDFAGFMSWQVWLRFAKYMHEHRIQKNGQLRPADNWKKGIPRDVYIQSMMRHMVDVWAYHEQMTDLYGNDFSDDSNFEKGFEDALCALLFNVQGYLYELMEGR